MSRSQRPPRYDYSEHAPSSNSTTSPPSQATPESDSDHDEGSDLEVYLTEDGIETEAHELKVLRRDSFTSTLDGVDKEAIFDAEEVPDVNEEEHEEGRRSSRRKRRRQGRRRLRWTEEEEKDVIRKLDRRLVILLALLYMLSFLDRSNIGNALISGLPDSLSLSQSQTSWLLTAFYITYILFEWMTLCYRLIRPSIYIPFCVFFWGFTASVQSIAPNFATLLFFRALLGVAEAAFGPGVPFYLSRFFRPDELAYRVGIFISAAPLATTFASSLAWLIVWVCQKSSIGIAPWRALFLVEGFPSVLVAVWAYYLIPDEPSTAPFLTPRQRQIATLRLVSHSSSMTTYSQDSKIEKAALLHTLRDPKPYLTASMFFLANISFSSLPIFLPTLLRHLQFSSLASQSLSAPPYLFAFVILLISSSLSDRLRMRSRPIILLSLISALAYATIAILEATSNNNNTQWLRYALVFPAAAGFFSAITLIITWTLNNQDSETGKGTGMALIQYIGQCGPLLGVRLFPEEGGEEEGSFVFGMVVCAVSMAGVAGLSWGLGRFLKRENEGRGDDDGRRGEYRELEVGEELGEEGDEGGGGVAKRRKGGRRYIV
ncbi:MAG: hypothetical protein Q9227_008812 [Pyrenula ochraceoflavens]